MTGDTLAPSEAAAPAPAEERALEALRLDYGAAYLIGHEDAHGWYAARRDAIGSYLAHDTPDELRAAMAEDHEMRAVPLWCRHCGKRAVFAAGAAVHAATLSRAGAPDGHQAEAAGEEPAPWRAAREIEADYAGLFAVTARLGILRAEWSPAVTAPGETPVHYTAPDEAGMRRQLDDAVTVIWRQWLTAGASR